MVPEVVGSNPIGRPICALQGLSERDRILAMTAFWTAPDFDDHESVQLVRHRASGLTAILALHSTHLGPGAGELVEWKPVLDRDRREVDGGLQKRVARTHKLGEREPDDRDAVWR